MSDRTLSDVTLSADKHVLLEQLLQQTGNEANVFPLSFAQQRLWFLDQLQPNSSLYNLPAALHLSGPLDLAALYLSLNTIIARHEVLRTTIVRLGRQPFQRVVPALRLALPVQDLRGLPSSERTTAAQQFARVEVRRPFDLATGPLLRVALLRLGADEHLLLLTMHHIIADGWSIGVFVRDLAQLYAAAVSGRPAALPELPIQYADYAAWQREWLQGEVLETQLAYWRARLAGAPDVLALPADRPRGSLQTFHGALERFALPSDLSASLNTLSRHAGVTLFMTLLAAFQALLARYTAQEDVLVGSPIAGRSRSEIEELIGLFVNTLVLRGDLSGNPRFDDLLGRVRATCLEAYAHQDLPFEQLVETLRPTRDLSYAPLVQVVFALQNAPMPALELAELTLTLLELDNGTAKFDLTLNLEERSAGLSGWFEYNTDLFAAPTIARLVGHFRTLLAGVVADPSRRIADIPILTAAEQRQVFEVWNASTADYPRDAAVHALFEIQAAYTPDLVALVFETNDEGPRTNDESTPSSFVLGPSSIVHLTYAELNRRANQLAHWLQRHGVGPDTLVALCAERTAAAIVGMLGILKAGGAYVALDPAYPSERISFMLKDSGAAVLVTNDVRCPEGAQTNDQIDHLVTLSPCHLVSLEADWPLIARESTENLPRRVQPDQRAYVLYTSGSTGSPKGVMVRQRGLLNLVYGLRTFFDDPAVRATALITSLSFDISVNQIFPTLLFGRTLHVIPDAVKLNSAALMRYMRENSIHLMDAVPSYMQAVLTDLAPARLKNTFRYLLIGGEKLEVDVLQKIFGQLGPEVAVVNIYGLTELTDINALAVIRPADLEQPIMIGRPLQNNQLYILNARRQLQPIGVVGELCIAGESLSRGYHQRPDLTAARFIPNPFSDCRLQIADCRLEQSTICNLQSAIGTRLVRTGDLGRWRADGQIEVLGRIDHQVKVRGFRIEIGEIEAVLRSHERVRECVVVARLDEAGEQRLVAYVVQGSEVRSQGSEDSAPDVLIPDPRPLIPDLRAFLKQRLPNFMLPSLFVRLDGLPKTPNGKIDRKALPAPDPARAEREERYVAPRTPIEEQVASIWAQMLRLERVGVYDDFFELGGHSLLATQLMSRLREVFHVEISLRTLFEAPTLTDLAGQIERTRRATGGLGALPIQPAARGIHAPLSFAQQRLWFIHQLDPNISAYHLAAAMRIAGPLNPSALRQSLNEMMRRHEALRTTFATVEGRAVQVIARYRARPLSVLDLTNIAEARQPNAVRHLLSQEAQRPFDLTRGPLLRARVLRLDAQEHILQVTMHHLVSDGWSVELFIREVSALYAAFSDREPSPLPELPLQYADYAIWQREWLQGEGDHLGSPLQTQLAYWRARLNGEPSALELPTDRPRPAIQTFRGARRPVLLSAELTAALKRLSRGETVTLFMTLLAAFQTLLYRYTGQADVAVGSPIANRNRSELEGLIGLFANTLVFRADLADNPRFRELLARTRENALGAYTHQDLPFEQLVDALHPDRDLSRNPLFQVLFALQSNPLPTLEVSGLSLSPLEIDTGAAQFDLTLNLTETARGLSGWLEYNTDLFDAATIARMARYIGTLLGGIVANPASRLAELPLLTEAEQQQLREWNATHTPIPPDRCIHTSIEAQVERTPDAIALVFEAGALTYAGLNRRANQLAHRLMRLGVRPGVLVGLCTERSAEMLIGLLSILKAGGAYVPLDPTYPHERLAFMLADCMAPVLVTQQWHALRLPATSAHILCLDSDRPAIARENQRNPSAGATAADLAYVIYTSGSTGRPKGVMIGHANVQNFCTAMDRCIGARPAGVWLAVTSISFDISVFELLWTLARGFEIVVQGEPLDVGPAAPADRRMGTNPLDMSLFYFASDDRAPSATKYRLLLEGARFADRHGFAAVWTPERHFHAFGGLYPNPSLTSAALATITERIQLRAGSVVLPLHNPIRVAEEWAVVDNLSQGRVGVSFASGWHADDFVLAPDHYADRRELMLREIETVRKLWRGEAITYRGGAGNIVEVQIVPRPVQPELPIWLTAAGSPDTFRAAGALGVNLLTHLLGQSIEELAEKIALYRQAWRQHGHTPGSGHVTLMLHTFIGPDLERVREHVRGPFTDYLRSSIGLLKNLARSLGQDVDADSFTEADMEALLAHAFDRYFETSGLFGTPEIGLRMIEQLQAIGVDEVACLIDFGVDADAVMASLDYLDLVRRRHAQQCRAADYALAAQLRRHRVTHLQCTPSMAQLLSADPLTLQALRPLEKLLLGGEALPAPLAERLDGAVAGRIRNMYGPTETTIWSTTHLIDQVRAGDAPPLGRPIANTTTYILDRHLRPAPIGVHGELHIGGAGVVRGYLRRPELTAERFIPNPFAELSGIGYRVSGAEPSDTRYPTPDTRLYKTGDLARYRPDGTIEFLGRLDHQVKLHGYRIELGEIEAALRQHPDVREAAVVTREDIPSDKRLIAYIVPNREQEDAELDLTSLSPVTRHLSPAGLPLRQQLSRSEIEHALANRQRHTLPNGKLIAHLSDIQTSSIYREIFVDEVYLKHGITLSDGDIIFDIGANIGLFTLFAHEQCQNITVYAFEPIPPTFDILQTNVTLYALNAQIFNYGISDRKETATLTFYPQAAGLSGRYAESDKAVTRSIVTSWLRQLSNDAGEKTTPFQYEIEDLDTLLEEQLRSETYTCEMTTISDIIHEHAIDRIDLLKIDVERSEAHVLNGIRPEDWKKIGQIVIEVHSEELLAQVVGVLETHDFTIKVEKFITVEQAAGETGSYVYMLYALAKDRPTAGERPARRPELAVSELRAFLKTKLPDYMIPSGFVLLQALPLTPNYKIDRRALPAPDSAHTPLQPAYVAPQTEPERLIAEIWQAVLHTEKVGIHDNFFEVGGNSMLLVQAHSKIREVFGKNLSMVDLFRHPTISSLAKYLSRERDETPVLEHVKERAKKQADSAWQTEAISRQQQFMQDRRKKRRKSEP